MLKLEKKLYMNFFYSSEVLKNGRTLKEKKLGMIYLLLRLFA